MTAPGTAKTEPRISYDPSFPATWVFTYSKPRHLDTFPHYLFPSASTTSHLPSTLGLSYPPAVKTQEKPSPEGSGFCHQLLGTSGQALAYGCTGSMFSVTCQKNPLWGSDKGVFPVLRPASGHWHFSHHSSPKPSHFCTIFSPSFNFLCVWVISSRGLWLCCSPIPWCTAAQI